MFLTDPTAYESLVSQLSSNLAADNFYTALTPLVGVIGGLVVFSFIYKRMRKMTNGATNGKAKI